jgi:hypothetical protein
MSMQTWAEKEIEIACKREREASGVENDGDWDYGCACYESALKAFKSLMGDGHSGFSIGLTKHILNRLIDGKPLTPIEDTEDTEDVWNDIIDRNDEEGYICFQCRRMSSLFKYVYDDGTVRYKDIDSCYGVDINNPNCVFNKGLVTKIIDEMFPITMPYSPGKAIAVYCENFLTDKWKFSKNGDFDTRGIFYAVKPDGEKIEINRFFKKSKDGWDEIDEVEYNERKAIKI